MNLLTALRRSTTPAHVSVRDQVLAAGYTLTERDHRADCRTVVAATMEGCDGTPIVGLVYRADYRCEEEVGVGEMRAALAGKDRRRTQMNKDGVQHTARFADVNGFVISTQTLPFRTYSWGDDLDTASTTKSLWGREHEAGWTPDYAEHYDSALAYTRRDEFARNVNYGWITMKDLRAKAKELGLTGLPRTKKELAEAIISAPEYKASLVLEDVWPADFHYGERMVIRADEGPVAAVVDALGDAIDAGALAVGNYSGAFTSGLFLYDARDETDAMRADRVARCDWHDARMAELAPVAARLKEDKIGWYALGRPTEFTDEDGATVVRYWLNGYSGGTTKDGQRFHGQPFGWYSLAELEDRKFATDRVEYERAERERAKEREEQAEAERAQQRERREQRKATATA